jgi:hypothetical protein
MKKTAHFGEPWVSTHGFKMSMAPMRALWNGWVDTHGSPLVAAAGCVVSRPAGYPLAGVAGDPDLIP